MRAIVRRTYGSPDVLRLEDVPAPTDVPDDGMLVRVRASSVNAYDWHVLRGDPFVARVSEGLRRPKTIAMGLDVAGTVEAVGSGVTHVGVGDAVFGSRVGALAELVSGRTFTRMPTGCSFADAAAVPVAGMTALQALRDRGHVGAGQRVLITGAGGGVGTLAVQLAKVYGAQVTAVTSAPKVDAVRALGADAVVAADHGELPDLGGPFDLLVDVGGYRRLARLSRHLAPDGTLVLVGPGRGRWLGPILHVGTAIVRSRFGGRRFVPFLSKASREDLDILRDLIEAGRVRPVVGASFPLEQTADAIRALESGQVVGKVVVTMTP